ncbi:MFS transporter [Myroides odoratimimus subsp. xuanwuensis]
MVVLIVLNAFEALAVTTAMPTISDELDGLRLYALAFAGPMATGVLAMVVVGSWCDRSGPRTPLLATVVLFTVGLVIAGIAQTMGVLVVGRVVQGFGAGMVVALYVVVARIYPAELHPRVFAAFAAAWVVPSLVGPLAAGLVTEHLGWRWVFLGVGALILPTVLLLRAGLADPRLAQGAGAAAPWSGRRIGAGVVAGAAVLVLHVGSGEGATHSWQLVVTTVAVTVVALPLALRRLVPSGTLQVARGLPAVVAMRGLLGASYFTAEVYLPLVLTERYDLAPSVAGLVLTTGALTWSGASWLQSRLGNGAREALVLRLGPALIGAGVLAALVVVVLDLHPALAIVTWTLAGAGMGLSYPRLSVLLLRYSQGPEQGTNSSAGQIMEYVAIAVALAAAGALFATLVDDRATAAYAVPFVLALVFAAGAVMTAGRAITRDTPDSRVRREGAGTVPTP